MARAHLRAVLVDGAGNARGTRSVNIYQPGTTSAVIGTMYDAASGGNVVTNPRTTDARGQLEVWLEYPQDVDFVFSDDTGSQRVKGKSAPRDTPTTATLYAEPNGNNSNDGLSWQTAKKDILGAYDALPSTGGIIHFADLTCVDATNTDRGLWILGSGDTNYNGVLPTGWRQEKGGLRLVGESTYAAPGSRIPSSRLRGGSASSLTKPLIWYSGSNQSTSLENIYGITGAGEATGEHARPMILGLDSSGSGATNNSGFSFFNITLQTRQEAGYGPTVYDVSSYWLYANQLTLSGNQNELYTADKRAAWVIAGNSSGEGLKWIRNSNFNKGGGMIHYTSNGGLNIRLSNIVMEGDATQPAAPVYWLNDVASGITPDGSVLLESICQSDTVTNSDVIVRVNAGNDPGLVVVSSANGRGFSGPMTHLGSGIQSYVTYSDSPTANRGQGFARGRVHGQHDSARRSFTPTAVRFTNRANQDVSAWGGLGGTATVTTGKAAPDGTTAAAELSGGNLHRRVATFSLTPALGDWCVIGVWMRSVNAAWPSNMPNADFSNTNYKFDSGGGVGSNSITMVAPFRANAKEWTWVWRAQKVITLDAGACDLNYDMRCDTAKAVEYYAPVLYYITAAAGWTDAEVLEYATHMTPTSNSSLVTAGEVTTLASHKLNALGGLKVGGGSNISKILTGTKTYDPADMVADGDATSTTCTVTGAAVGDPAFAGLTTLTTQVVTISAHVSAADTVTVVLHNKNGAGLNITSGTLNVTVFKQ